MADHHSALIQAMVLVSASDGEMSDHELAQIGQIVKGTPAFAGFDSNELIPIASACARALAQEDGLDLILASLVTKLKGPLAETAYTFALDVAASDGVVTPEEMSILEMLRHALKIDRLIAAAIERGARARFYRP